MDGEAVGTPVGRPVSSCSLTLLVVSEDDVEVDVDPVVWAVSSRASVCCALATAATSACTCWSRALVDRVASVWPADTGCPSLTGTVATWPATGNDTVDWLTELIVPADNSVWVNDPVCTVASR